MVDLASIRNATVFEGLTHEELEELAGIAQEIRAGKSDRLFTSGQEATTFFVVKNGCFALTVQLRELDERVEIPVEEKKAGDAFGWSALVEPYRSVTSAYCTEDGALIGFPRRELEALLSADTHLGHRFLRNLSQLMGSRIRAMQKLWINEVEQSIARVHYWTQIRLDDDWIREDGEAPRKHGSWWRPSST
ncbi:MAG: cyclic nucleotide-binding domain-containing protein [Myxococcales bacterium]|nr:cyclic nucleotide-binding domain-containing protein [Myxococcales bacterium]MDH5306070.1 cyclic nucleotide-binding domain-containing protein [Myxococcales bacterium]MDH5567316.1 cyclic nucleotide-binding domain-containing protein [Myxococcales bacterium]